MAESVSVDNVIKEEEPKADNNDSPNMIILKRQTSLIMPPSVDKSSKYNTISLNRDIYMAFVILMTYGPTSESNDIAHKQYFWDKMGSKDRIKFIVMIVMCMMLQFGVLLLLLIEMILYPPWNEYTPNNGSSALVISIKMFALMCIALYICKEWISMQIFVVLALSHKVEEFEQLRVKYFAAMCACLAWCCLPMALCLSVGLITTAQTGFDAVLNAVGITFVLDLDDWMYTFVQSHIYIQDEYFDIKYEYTNNIMRNSEQRAWVWFEVDCYAKCSKKYSTYIENEKNRINPDVSRKFCVFTAAIFLCLTAAFIFLGHQYNVWYIFWIGIALASLIGFLILWLCVDAYIITSCTRRKSIKQRPAFWKHAQNKIDNEYILKIQNADHDEKQINDIKQQFVTECFEYAVTEQHIYFDNDEKTKSKLLKMIQSTIDLSKYIDADIDDEIAEQPEEILDETLLLMDILYE